MTITGIFHPRAFLAAATLSLIVCASPALAASETKAASVVDAFHAALHRSDPAAALRLLADNVIIYEEGEAEQSKAEYAAHHLQADSAFSSKMHEQILRRADGGDDQTAWVATEGRTTGLYKKRAIDRFTTETMVLQRGAGEWKIVHIHWSSRAAPKPSAAKKK